MARKDWFYVNLPAEMGEALDKIVEKEGKKYAIYDKTDLVKTLVRDFLIKYEEKHGLIAARKVIRGPMDTDLTQPIE